jgi:hypothetical protein
MSILTKIIEDAKDVYTFLSGKKTYILGVILAVYGALKAFAVIDTTPAQDASVMAILGALMGMSIRGGIANLK